MIILILGIICTILAYYILSFTLTRVVYNHFNRLRSSSDFLESANNIVHTAALPNATVAEPGKQRIIIGGKKINFTTPQPLKSFGRVADNIKERTLFAIEDQEFEDWLDAIEKIFKMLRKDFFGTIKSFFIFLINLSKPLETEDFESRMARLNAQRQKMELDKMVTNLKDNQTADVKRLETDQVQTLPSKVAKIASTSNLIVSTRKIIVLKKTTEEDFELTTDEVEENEDTQAELTEFERVEQRLLSKLRESGMDHYDLWLDLADLYVKNNAQDKARQVYTYVAKNSKDFIKQKAINGIIGLD
jgi:hypothetical protein